MYKVEEDIFSGANYVEVDGNIIYATWDWEGTDGLSIEFDGKLISVSNVENGETREEHFNKKITEIVKKIYNEKH